MKAEQNTEISIIDSIETMKPLEIFKAGGMALIVDAIRAEVSANVYSAETSAGRKHIAGSAYKVSQSKSLLDKMGKSLADELNSKLKPINAERKYAKDELNALRDEIRRPLTEWEDAQKREKEREAAEKLAAELAEKVEHDHELGLLLDEKFNTEKREKDAEAERIKSEEAEALRLKVEEAERIKAEEDAKAIIEKAKQEKIDAEARAAQAELDKIIANERAIAKAEEAEAQRIKEMEEAEARRVREIKEAEARERARINSENEKEAAEQLAREQNRANVSRVRSAAKESFMERCGLSEEQAKKVVLAISKSKIPNVVINY